MYIPFASCLMSGVFRNITFHHDAQWPPLLLLGVGAVRNDLNLRPNDA